MHAKRMDPSAFLMPSGLQSGPASVGSTSRQSRASICRSRRCEPKCSAATSSMIQMRKEIENIAGRDRGLFGLEDREREALDSTIRAVEKENPTKLPTANNAAAAEGSWKLLYTNLEILGRKRVRLAIGTSKKAGFVTLGDFVQIIDPLRRMSKSVVEFDIMVAGSGTFSITAQYEVVSDQRVNVATTGTALEPESFQRLLGENESLLTEIFTPDGYLDITYLDDAVRIGRDGKGHVFVLEKMESHS